MRAQVRAAVSIAGHTVDPRATLPQLGVSPVQIRAELLRAGRPDLAAAYLRAVRDLAHRAPS